jgi:hypothetical protein
MLCKVHTLILACTLSWCCLRDVCRATAGGYRDPSKAPWEDRRQPLVPALEGCGAPDASEGADIPGEELRLCIVHCQGKESAQTFVGSGCLTARPRICLGHTLGDACGMQMQGVIPLLTL